MFKLSESPQYKEDYKKYQELIRTIKDPQIQKELTSIFLDFVGTVKLIDKYHSDLTMVGKMPTGVTEARSKLIECKKKLDTKLSNHHPINN